MAAQGQGYILNVIEIQLIFTLMGAAVCDAEHCHIGVAHVFN